MLDPSTLDLPTAAFIGGSAANRLVLEQIRAEGHPQLRVSHGYIFQRLIAGEPTVGELADTLGVTQQAASKATRELETLGYIARHPDPADRRVTRLTLTERGTAAVELARTARAGLERQLADSVGARDVAAARRVMEALLNITGASADVRARTVAPPAP